jgi:hypothetical protein
MAIHNTLVSTPNAAIYTSTDSTAVTAVYFCNNTVTNPVTLNVYVAPSGTSVPVDPMYQIAQNVLLASGDTYQLSDFNGNGIKLVLDNGDFIAADCDDTIAVTVVHVGV